MADYAWAAWLAAPVAATVLASAWTWWRGRAPKPPTPRASIAEHEAYLTALTRRAVGSSVGREPDGTDSSSG